ncbi:MAG: ABC transporter permease [Ruminococcaceae bacterium]|nr:ABC transporter permease [Oscillospiraceae bacterium]
MSKVKSKVKSEAREKKKSAHEPLFHVAKRDRIPFWKSILIRFGAVLLAIAVCILFALIFADVSPDMLIKSMVDGTFGTERRQWLTAEALARLLGIALALTPAFVMRFWNIGGEGQVLMGALASVTCVIYFGGKVSEPVLLLMMLAAALLAGALWGFIPSFFKALWNSNETLFTLMMNYVAIQLIEFMLVFWNPKHPNMDPLPHGHLNLFPSVEHYGDELTMIVIIFAVALLMFIYLRYSKHGYEISVVGESENTARYVGISVKKVTMRTMALSGLLCGLVGFLIVAVFDNSVSTETAGGLGFTAIMVSWMAKFNPLVMIGTAGIVAFLDKGAACLNTNLGSVQIDNFLTRSMGENAPTGIPTDLPNILVAIILFFIVGCEFFINYQLKFRKFEFGSKKTERKEEAK